jgi:hypothetical protein
MIASPNTSSPRGREHEAYRFRVHLNRNKSRGSGLPRGRRLLNHRKLLPRLRYQRCPVELSRKWSGLVSGGPTPGVNLTPALTPSTRWGRVVEATRP